ncbi:SURF1 family protein [Sulfitobacter sp. G21635-S1]|uniref:SURF1 family protein n=1 Tax=Sulfitobacter sp. G21635-S1 TaxID=3014043 RepID=UPI0022AF46BD|nr:SURF1 family protein [Sulfitobacter sp. G21635-S1]MCZ4258682.1 SURF1 family protein [Sulfitobacter sp. G21635-S1]
MSRALFVILIGLGGAAILISLGVWQVQRLTWKQGILAEINGRIEAPAVPLPEQPDPKEAAYLPVEVTGSFEGQTLRVLVSQKDQGAGYRLITALNTGDRRLLVDRGYIPNEAVAPPLPDGPVTITGNLQWPQETDSFTPAPDIDGNIWFARDVTAMSQLLQSEPVLVVARALSYDAAPVSPLPVDTSRIPNDHLQYAITWFSLAAIWAAMSLYFLRRRAKTES